MGAAFCHIVNVLDLRVWLFMYRLASLPYYFYTACKFHCICWFHVYFHRKVFTGLSFRYNNHGMMIISWYSMFLLWHLGDTMRGRNTVHTVFCCDMASIYFTPIWQGYLIIIWTMLRLLQYSLQWRHNELDGVSNHRRLECLLNRLFSRRSKKTSKLRVNGLCARNSPVTGEFLAQRSSNNTENVSIWWRRHVVK